MGISPTRLGLSSRFIRYNKTVSEVLLALHFKDGLITLNRLNDLIERTLKVTIFTQLHLPGLHHNRIDVFVPGLAILVALFETFQIKVCVIRMAQYVKA